MAMNQGSDRADTDVQAAAINNLDMEAESECSPGESATQTKSTTDSKPIEADMTQSNWHAIFVCIFVANTGLFHGYDNGVVSEVFNMSSFRSMMGWPEHDDARVAFEKGCTVNGFNIGAAISAILCGHLIVDRHGRRPALILGSLLFAAGGLVQALASNGEMLIVGRLIAGVGVGITSCAGPAYIAEVAPTHLRGAMVGVYQSNVCLAILAASLINYFDGDFKNGWRWSLSVQTFLGVATAIGLLFVCETPRFLESVGRCEEANRVLGKLRGNAQVAARELGQVRAELAEEKAAGSASWSEVFTNPFFRNVVILGCFVQFFQIMTGINAMVSYGGTLFNTLGVSGFTAMVLPSFFFVLGNSIGSFGLAERLGRRPLLIFGMMAMAATMLTGGIVTLATSEVGADGETVMPVAAGYVVIFAVVGYMFSFGMSWGFGAWLYIPEIMPLRVRGKAVGLCTGTNWGPANVISAFITPMMIAGPMGPGGTLLFFGAVCSLVVPFAVLCLPETRSKTLEEITPMFRFATWRDFRKFVRGNLKSGSGMGNDLLAKKEVSSDSTTDSCEVSSEASVEGNKL